MTRFGLTGKVVLITGAAQGIGLGTAKAMHARGASVTLVDLDLVATQQAAASVGERTLGLAGDVTDAASLQAAAQATVQRFGGIDVAIANAGISPPATTARAYEDGLWEKVIDVNLTADRSAVSDCPFQPGGCQAIVDCPPSSIDGGNRAGHSTACATVTRSRSLATAGLPYSW